MFYCLMKDDIGWAKQIRRTLTEYEITASIDDITTTSNAARKTQVTNATEKEHKEKLVDLCLERGREKTKTRYLLEILKSDTYTRCPNMQILRKGRIMSRAQIMMMYGMLYCGKNFKVGHGGECCKKCKMIDDENHRINYCPEYREINLHDSSIKIDFRSIHLGKDEVVDRVLEVVWELWVLSDLKNCMRL